MNWKSYFKQNYRRPHTYAEKKAFFACTADGEYPGFKIRAKRRAKFLVSSWSDIKIGGRRC